MARKTDPTDRIVDAALALAGERGWRATQLYEVAARVEVDLATLYRHTGGKTGILRAFARRIDQAMLLGASPADPGETPHDLLFDTIMRRFDALGPYRPGLEVLGRELRAQPLAGLAQAPGLLRSMRWALQAAGIPSQGIQGALLERALGVAYVATLRVWLADDTPDLGRTMAALDRNLRRLARLSPMLRPRNKPVDGGVDDPAPAPV